MPQLMKALLLCKIHLHPIKALIKFMKDELRPSEMSGRREGQGLLFRTPTAVLHRNTKQASCQEALGLWFSSQYLDPEVVSVQLSSMTS